MYTEPEGRGEMNKSRPFRRVARTQPVTESQNTFVESRWKKTVKHGEMTQGAVCSWAEWK